MNTYFIRHTVDLDIDDETRQRLWDERRIAIHYPHDKHSKLNDHDNKSTDPGDYSGSGLSCMTILSELGSEGGYVCAQYYPRPERLVGCVKPGSHIELLEGTWGSRNGLDGRHAILKTLRLTRTKVVKPVDYAVLQVGRPRQGAIKRWPSARETIKNLVEDVTNKPALCDLSESQQEILCSEFLRLPQAEKLGLPRLAHLRLPTGRTMPDIDIIGIATDGKPLLAQVTYASLSNAEWKLDRLALYQDHKRAHLVLFCNCSAQTTSQGVTIFPIEQAYRIFASTPLGAATLRKSI